MKKISILAVCFIALFASCSKEQALPEDKTTSKVTVEINVADLAPDTKALKQNWEDGDIINIWFQGVSSPNYPYWKQLPHLVLTRTAGAWVASDVDEALLSASGNFSAVYESSNSLFASATDNERLYFSEGTPFRFDSFSNDTKTIHVPLICKAVINYTYDSGTKKISANIDTWRFETRLQVTVKGLSYVADRYAMTFANNIYYFSQLYYYDGSIDGSGTDDCEGIKDSFLNTWIEGVSNTDGTAFYFYYPKDNTTRDYTIYLVDKVEKKVYSFTKNAAIATTPDSLKGISIDFSTKFTDVTSTYPLK